ncbi:glycosyltransferase family 2 protein [Candidatus Eisenbacteria bacterium]|uniref:Glycosyltransferase family 2 protein n=1 Tax=Eiseniibacteriota bacterium TaxID=2212470 RepID=A0ABV6YJY3_UNCEI
MSALDFSVVIPCFNKDRAIGLTVDQRRESLAASDSYEMIFVDDGSTDETVAILANLASKDKRIRVIRHERNRGYGAALKTGIRRAIGELIVITDADGSYPNERIPELVALSKDADMVVGARTAANVSYPLIRKIPKLFLKAHCTWLAGQPIPDMNSGLRVFRRDLAERFLNILPDGFSFTTTITLAMMTNHYEVRYIPIGYNPRIGKSKIRPIHDTLDFFLLILRTGTYFAPTRVFLPLAGILGLGFLASLCYDLFALSNLTDKTVLLLLFSMNTALFALLADMIDKRSGR